ncbi:MAG TPA: hypothetical protein PKX93_08280, partial [bacterium]|nr:hypothetical protein [bacterium]
CRIKVRDKHGERESQRISFLTVPSNNPGFIEVSSLDGRYFQFSNGSFFYPLGLNIRSPTDTRYAHLRKRPLDPDSGTFYYEKIFQQMKQSGQNFCEVWMANWFAALEWIENRPGYRGAGFYNLRHAWKLDRLLELAETNGIYLQIVLINHGQLSTYCDEEWPDHPYNEKNGGFLKKPEEFFTDTRAEQLMRRKFRYIVARWSYSPNIFGWVLLNEINLTGSRRDFYLSPAVTTWYERLAGYLKKIDPYHHLVSAHYTILVDNDLLRSSVVDYTITNAYYESGRTSLVEFLKEIYRFNARFDKPTFVSEFGGTPWGATDPNLVRDVIAGLWGSFHLPFAGAPAFWWHRLVTELNLYPIYQNLARYAASVDRLKTALEIEEVKTEGKIKTLGLGNFCEALVWVYDPLVMTRIQDLTSFSELRDVRIALGKKKPGRYKVEFWSMEDGFLQEGTVENQSDTLSVTLPPFRRWLAVKIKAEV